MKSPLEKKAEDARLTRDNIEKGAPSNIEHLYLFWGEHFDETPATFNCHIQRDWSEEKVLSSLTRKLRRCAANSQRPEAFTTEIVNGFLDGLSANLTSQVKPSHSPRTAADFVAIRVVTENNVISNVLQQDQDRDCQIWLGVLECKGWNQDSDLCEAVGQAVYYAYLNRDLMHMKFGHRVNLLAIRAAIDMGDLIIGARWGYWDEGKFFIENKMLHVCLSQEEGSTLQCSSSEKLIFAELIERFLSLEDTPELDSSS